MSGWALTACRLCLAAALAPLGLSACVSGVISMLLGTKATWSLSVLLCSVCETSMLHCLRMVLALCKTHVAGGYHWYWMRQYDQILPIWMHHLISPGWLEQMQSFLPSFLQMSEVLGHANTSLHCIRRVHPSRHPVKFCYRQDVTVAASVYCGPVAAGAHAL